MATDKHGSKTGEVGPGKPPVEHQFKPGNKAALGNSGRPKSRPIAAAIRELLDANDGEAIRAMAKVGLSKALKGDFRFFKELAERIDGKVLERLDLTSNDETIGQSSESAIMLERVLAKMGEDMGVGE